MVEESNVATTAAEVVAIPPRKRVVFSAQLTDKDQTLPYSLLAENFNDVYIPFLDCPYRYQIYFGGYGSGKSKFIFQRTVLDMAFWRRNFICFRATKEDIRTSIYNEMTHAIDEMNLTSAFTCTMNPFTIKCNLNGRTMNFFSLEDVERVKSYIPAKGVLTDIIIEEATDIPDEKTFNIIDSRLRGIDVNEKVQIPKRCTMMFNPVSKKHFIYNRFFAGRFNNNDVFLNYQVEFNEDKFREQIRKEYGDVGERRENEIFKMLVKNYRVSILKTTYVHNRFLGVEECLVRESAKGYDYEVGTLGNWGVDGKLIFEPRVDWKMEDLSTAVWKDKYEHLPKRNGLDFGFDPDPFAYNSCYIDTKNKIIYVVDECSDTQSTTYGIGMQLKKKVRNETVYCDSGALGKQIVADLKNSKAMGRYVINARGVSKKSMIRGVDYIKYKIQWLKGYTIIIDISCKKTIEELENAQWRKNKQGDEVGQIEGDHHHIDAITYALNKDMLVASSSSMRMAKIDLRKCGL